MRAVKTCVQVVVSGCSRALLEAAMDWMGERCRPSEVGRAVSLFWGCMPRRLRIDRSWRAMAQEAMSIFSTNLLRGDCMVGRSRTCRRILPTCSGAPST